MIRVILVDDHALVRRGAAELIGETVDIVVAGMFGSAEKALLHMEAHHSTTDVVVTDLSLPGIGGLALVETIRARYDHLAVVVLSTHGPQALGLQAIQAGAAGYVEKSLAPEHLLTAIRLASSGGRYVSPELGEVLADAVLASDSAALSVREAQVVRALAEGKSRDETAQLLSVRAATVTTYKRRALRKLGLTTDAGLVRHAIQSGWIE